MRRQYLGDSKDSFKWDYHDYLMRQLEYDVFHIALMMTPNDNSSYGKTDPSLFPAIKEVIKLCCDLKKERYIDLIKELPTRTSASYRIEFHKKDQCFKDKNRIEYFSGIENFCKQVLFLDPNTGFEPEKSISDNHVAYKDISYILNQVSESTLLSVFQHYKYSGPSFIENIKSIKKRIDSKYSTAYSTAIYWDKKVMFVAVSKSKEIITKVAEINQGYVKIIREKSKTDSIKIGVIPHES